MTTHNVRVYVCVCVCVCACVIMITMRAKNDSDGAEEKKNEHRHLVIRFFRCFNFSLSFSLDGTLLPGSPSDAARTGINHTRVKHM